MNKNKIILMIAGILILFTLFNYIATGLCAPSKKTQVGSLIEGHLPKLDSENLDELRRLWALYFKKFCGGASNQIL